MGPARMPGRSSWGQRVRTDAGMAGSSRPKALRLQKPQVPDASWSEPS